PPPEPRRPQPGRFAMLRLDARRGVRFCDGLTRRDFLHAGALVPLGLTLPGFLRAAETPGANASGSPKKDADLNCIVFFVRGGQSQLARFDPKPKAPAEVRGPFQPIATKAPGVQITEIFPKVAQHTDKFSVIRSVYHTAAAVHDTGHQMMQTGRLF